MFLKKNVRLKPFELRSCGFCASVKPPCLTDVHNFSKSSMSPCKKTAVREREEAHLFHPNFIVCITNTQDVTQLTEMQHSPIIKCTARALWTKQITSEETSGEITPLGSVPLPWPDGLIQRGREGERETLVCCCWITKWKQQNDERFVPRMIHVYYSNNARGCDTC